MTSKSQMVPSLSVVVPAYQAEHSIGRLLESILLWDGNDIEVVVVDDGSTDRTSDIVADFAVRDSRIHLINKRNGGRSSARNVGIGASRGDWLMFADSDDCLLDGWAQKVRNYMRENFDLVVFSMLRSDGLDSFDCSPVAPPKEDRVIKTAAEIKNILIDGSFRNYLEASGHFEWNACWGRLYRRSNVDSIVSATDGEVFPEGLKFSEDRLFNLRYLSILGDKPVLFDYSAIYYWDMGLSSTVAHVSSGDAESLIAFRKALDGLAGAVEGASVVLVMSMEIASQFRRAATLPVSELSEATVTWQKVLDSGALRGCKRYVASFMGKRSWMFRPAVWLLYAGYPHAALWFQHLIQILGAIV